MKSIKASRLTILYCWRVILWFVGLVIRRLVQTNVRLLINGWVSVRDGNPLLYLLSKVWHYADGCRGKIVQYWAMFIVSKSIELLVGPYLWSKMIQVIQAEGLTDHSIHLLFKLLGCSIVLVFVDWSLHGPARVIECSVAFRVRANYRKHLLQGVMTLPLEWHRDHHSGDTIDKIEKGANALLAFAENIFQIIYALVCLVGSYIVLVYLSRPAAATIVVMIVATVLITIRFDKVLVRQYEELNHADNKVAAGINDAISKITTVIILRVERWVFGAVAKKIDEPYALYNQNNRLNEYKWFCTSLCCCVMVAVVLGTYFVQHRGAREGALVSVAYLLIQYLRNISGLFFTFTSIYGDIIQRRSRVANTEELSRDFQQESFANHVLPKDWQEIAIEGLNFSYEGKESKNLHLRDICLSFKRGERIAFVGSSGSGKTTMLKVIRDLFHPRDFTLSVDGQVIREGFPGISRAIGMLQQDAHIFASTLWLNLTMGVEYAVEFVRKFVEMACFTEVVETSPAGYETEVAENGDGYSGGQKQRLAIARGLMACRDKAIVLLDEPTSSLDAVSERRVYENIFQEFADKTIVSSIHRLHLLSLFHTIYVFKRGRIVARGTLEDLLNTSSDFRKMWEQYHKQSSEKG